MTVGIVAAIFYNNHTASWSDSPSGSRIENQDCISLGFYDSHDIWHFLSALGEFMGLMVWVDFLKTVIMIIEILVLTQLLVFSFCILWITGLDGKNYEVRALQLPIEVMTEAI